MPAPAERVDLEALADLRTPWCVHVAATLRIADHLQAGPADVDALAGAAGCDPAALRTVLRHLVSRGVFEEPQVGRFALNEAAHGLLDRGLRDFLDLDGLGGRFAGAWGTLLTYVRTGESGYAERFGRPFFDDLAANPELGASFDALMGPEGHGPADADLPLQGGWDAVGTVVDVGGGTGSLLAALLQERPGLRGVLVDLPGTLERAAPLLEAAGVADRVERVAGSFFDVLPSGADVYLLSKVLHDWPDADAARILARCAEAAGDHGRVLVIGGVVEHEADIRLAPESVLVGGRDRTPAELQALAARAGLVVAAVGRTGRGRVVVELAARSARGRQVTPTASRPDPPVAHRGSPQ